MRDVTVSWGGRIEIGRVGENQAVRVVWPELLAEWAKLYGSGTVQLAVRRPNDTAPYPAVCTVEDGTIAWVVTAADVAQAGVGECELSYLVDGVVAKSQTWKTVIRKSLTGADMAEPPDEPAKAWCEDVQEQIGKLNELETEDKSSLVGAINEARDRVYDDAGVTPVTYTYVNPLTKKDDSVTLLVREGTLTQIGDDATDAVKIAWNATMYLAASSQTSSNMPKTQMDNWVTLYRAGLISKRFEYQVTTAPIWRESIMYSGASQNILTYQRTGQETVRMYYNLTTDTLESYSAFISPLKRTQKPDGTSSVSQFALAADPTADMQVATKRYVDDAVENAGGGDISLGLSGIMEPGEVPVVKTVDDNGVPTSWGTRYIMDGATGSNSDLISFLALKAWCQANMLQLTGGTVSGALTVNDILEVAGSMVLPKGKYILIMQNDETKEPGHLYGDGEGGMYFIPGDADGAYQFGAAGLTLPADPTDNMHAATKRYVDAAITTAIGGIDALVGTGEVTT